MKKETARDLSLWLGIAAVLISGAFVCINRYFAKSSTMTKAVIRQDIGATDHQIMQREQQIMALEMPEMNSVLTPKERRAKNEHLEKQRILKNRREELWKEYKRAK